MNYIWDRLNDRDFDVVDKWSSTDIEKYITFDKTFTISEYYDSFGFGDQKHGAKAIDSNGEIVGVVLYDTDRNFGSDINQFILQLFVVNPKLVNNGVGTKMLQDVIEANKNQYEVFKVKVEGDNIPFLKICSKVGFKRNKKSESNDGCYAFALAVNDKIIIKGDRVKRAFRR